MRKLIILFLLIIMVIPAMAQDNVLAYGDSVEGEVTNRDFEVEYVFEGAASDVIIVQLTPEDEFDGLSQPSIILLSTEGDVLSSVDASIGTASLVYELPKGGEYLVLATRQDGRSGESVGEYTLVLDTIPVIEIGEAIAGDMTNEEVTYYAIRMDASFLLIYERVSGDFYPEISLNIIENEFFSDDNLKTVATLSGDELSSGALGHDGSTGLMVIRVGEPLFAFSFSEETVSYTLEIIDLSQ